MTEQRTFAIDRAATGSSAGGIRFKGHAAVFGERAWIPAGRGFWEELDRQAFDRALEEDEVCFLLEHNPEKILGRTSSGTLRLSTDKRGLAVDADFPDTSYARDAAVSLERGDLSQMSFAFQVRDGGEEVSTLKDGSTLRKLTDVTLSDVSVVAYPAYTSTEAALRAFEARCAEQTKNHLVVLRGRLEAARKGW
jgi:HK97 family phage prohead protease